MAFALPMGVLQTSINRMPRNATDLDGETLELLGKLGVIQVNQRDGPGMSGLHGGA